jgi:Rad3-related DNA helicase
MEHPKKQKHHIDFLKSFPWFQYPAILVNQEKALAIITDEGGPVTLELPTGSGKTAIGYTFLKALLNLGRGPLFYITPNKTLVDQVKRFHPDVRVVYGRNEYQCLYYTDKHVSAEDSPCSLLDCPHRVDQETGQTSSDGVEPCPYLFDKWQAKQGGIVVCTTAFYLFTQIFSKEWPTPAGLVIDEAHRIAKTVRNSLSYEITDYHLRRSIDFLQDIDQHAANALESFLKKMIRIIKYSPARRSTLLEPHEIRDLLADLAKIDPKILQKRVRMALKRGRISIEQRDVLKRLETITYNLNRYFRSLEFSLPTGVHEPLNYTYGFYKEELTGKERVRYRLFIKAYYVSPLINHILSPLTVAYSATIGKPDVFGFETGIEFPFHSLPSDFPAGNARIFLPEDTPNLARNARSNREPTRILRRIAKACLRLSEKGIRSMVVVISERERRKFLSLCNEEGVGAISYGDGVPARAAATRFKGGEGSVLVGTSANYGEGVDLPKRIAPVIFFLRPGYPNPNDPATVFEERRFRGMRWRLWNWRVMIEALQVRGRNMRSASDIGVTIFTSQQFRRFLSATLPECLREAYVGDKSFDECIDETIKLLS